MSISISISIRKSVCQSGSRLFPCHTVSILSSRAMSSRLSSSSCELPPAAQEDPFVSICFYNVGIQNSEVAASKWAAKYKALKGDIAKIFHPSKGVQALFISEFGNMFQCIDGDMRRAELLRNKRLRGGVSQPAAHVQPSTQALFEKIVEEMDRDDIIVRAHPPYVALVSSDEWLLLGNETMNKLCSKTEIFVQRTDLRHKRSSQNVLVFNCHVPSPHGTDRRKRDVVQKLMQVGNEALRSGVVQPAAAWIVGGDTNLSEAQLMSESSLFVKASKPCLSKSGMHPTKVAHKSDIAISQGIALDQVQAWVGDHFPPCVSDAHDMVLVAGALEGMALPHPPPEHQTQTRSYKDVLVPVPPPLAPPPPTPSLLPLWHGVPPVPPAAPAEMQRGEPSSSQPALPRATAPVDVALASDDAHLAPPVPPAAPAEMQRGEPSSSEPALPRATAPVDVALASDDGHLAPPTPVSSRCAELCDVSAGPPLPGEPSPPQGTAPPSVAPAPRLEQPVPSTSDDANLASLRATHLLPMASTIAAYFASDAAHLAPAAQSVYPTTKHDIDAADDVISALSDCVDQHSAEHHSEAADDLLLLLFSDCDGFAVKSRADVHRLVSKPMQTRQDFIRQKSQQRADEHRGCAGYTVHQWQQWLSERELSIENMQDALALWKARFQEEDMHPETKEQVSQLREVNTRKSKTTARHKVHSAFNAHLKQVYGHSQMAKFFLKYPPAALNSLLAAWQQYMASDEYHQQRARSDRRSESPDLIHQQRELKHRCHVLRSQRRRVVKFAATLPDGQWIAPDMYELVCRLRSGALDAELDELTRQHGYGKLHATDGYLSSPTLFDHAPWPRGPSHGIPQEPIG